VYYQGQTLTVLVMLSGLFSDPPKILVMILEGSLFVGVIFSFFFLPNEEL